MKEQDYAGIKWISAIGSILSFFAVAACLLFSFVQLELYSPFSADESLPPEIYVSAVSSRQTESGLFGNITIESQEQVSLAMAVLFINGERCGDFSQGSLTVRVYPEDVLTVDASAYRRELSFFIVEASPSIRAELLLNPLCCNGDTQEFGKIQFK